MTTMVEPLKRALGLKRQVSYPRYTLYYLLLSILEDWYLLYPGGVQTLAGMCKAKLKVLDVHTAPHTHLQNPVTQEAGFVTGLRMELWKVRDH